MLLQKIKNYAHLISGSIASIRYGFPGKKIKIIGVTGTDGKTTTTHLVHHLLKSSGKSASMVSSVFAEIAGKQYDTGFHVTTPDAWMLQKFLRQAVDAGDEYLVLEVTSHGLDQFRVTGIDFKIGILTNITHEHLDYHKTYEAYVAAKEKLLLRSEVSIVNKDDESYSLLALSKMNKVLTYALDQDADFTLKKFPFTAPIPGKYNQYNCLAAIAAVKQCNVSDESIHKALSTFKSVKGRFEQQSTEFGFDVIIDFAHTPNSFEKILTTVKPLTKNKLIHIFGCAGLRDFKKRPEMGRLSGKYADIILITEEDYRIENINEIIEQIASGCKKSHAVEMNATEIEKIKNSKETVFIRIPNRGDAVSFAIEKLAQAGDIVLMTGKAHEQSLCRGTVEYPWSEHEAVAKSLAARKKS